MSALPALLLALAAAVAAALSLGHGARGAQARGGDAHAAAAGAGAAAVLVLLGANGGGLLRWGYALRGGDMREAGLVLGLALLAALAGTLMLAAALAAGGPVPPPRARLLGRRALLLAWALLVCGTGLVVVHAAEAALSAPREPAALAVVVIALGLGLWGCLAESAPADAAAAEGVEAAARRYGRLAAVLAVLAALAAGIAGWMGAGTSLTDGARALAAAALFGLGALPPTRLRQTRRALVLAALVAALPA